VGVDIGHGVGTPADVNATPLTLLEVDGHPAIAYYRQGALYYVRASEPEGPSWGSPGPTQLDGQAGQTRGMHLSMALIAGHPAVAYYDFSNALLRYLRADSADGSTWLDPGVSLGVPGHYNSLAEIDGKPMIGFANPADNHIYLAWSSNPTGADGWSIAAPTSEAPATESPLWLAAVDGLPALAYYNGDLTPGSVRYVRAVDTSYAAWSAPLSPAALPTFHGNFPSLTVADGVPMVAYWDEPGCTLGFVRAADAQGAAWQPAEEVDALGCPGSNTRLTTIGGRPALTYYAQQSRDLKFAIYY
jgi:hypothetical protein